jgi:IMP cyclohydrolase
VLETELIYAAMTKRPYPGRGLVMGRDTDGVAFGLYWLTGRSNASQQREIVLGESEILVRDLTDGTPDELRHYTAAIRSTDCVMVGNGTQVRELWDSVISGLSFENAHRTISYEPDPPINTPRITAIASVKSSRASDFLMTAAVSDPAWPTVPQHRSLHTRSVMPGQAQFVTTYSGDENDPQTDGMPIGVRIDTAWQSLIFTVWEALDPRLKVSITAFPLESKSFLTGHVINKNSH